MLQTKSGRITRRTTLFVVAMIVLLGAVVGGGVALVSTSDPLGEASRASHDRPPQSAQVGSDAPGQSADRPQSSIEAPSEPRGSDPSANSEGVTVGGNTTAGGPPRPYISQDTAAPVDVRDSKANTPWPPAPAWQTAPPNRLPRGELRGYGRKTPEGRTATVTVRVFAAESGDPLPGATVLVLDDSPVRIEVLSDHRGVAELPVTPPRDLDLRVNAPGRVRVRNATVRFGGQRDIVLDVHLERGVVLRGVVTGKGSDRGLAGVRLRVHRNRAWWAAVPWQEDVFPVGDAVTDGLGRYEIDAVPRMEPLVLAWEHPSFSWGAVTVEAGPDPDNPMRRDLVVPRGVEVSGLVTGHDDEAAAGAYVYALEWDDVVKPGVSKLHSLTPQQIDDFHAAHWISHLARVMNRVTARVHRARTDGEGRYRIRGLVEGASYRVIASAKSHGFSTLTDMFDAGAPRTEHLRLRGPGRVRFRVVRNRSGERTPVVGASVSFPWAHVLERLKETEAGVFGTALLTGGPLVVDAQARDHPPLRYVGHVEPGTTVTHDLRVARGHPVMGLVEDDVGAPVSGALVGMGGKDARTDAKGVFHIRGVP